jgi:hypothetical protein
MPEYSGFTASPKDSAARVFEKSRAIHADSPAPNLRPNDMALACPTCRAEGKPQARLFAKDDRGIYCMQGHVFTDLAVLQAMSPDKLPFVGHKAKQEGYRELRMEMPASLIDQLQAKFGDRLAETVAAFMDVIAQQRFLLIHEEDLTRIEQHLGQQVRNGKDLTGIVFERVHRITDQESEIERLRVSNNSGRPLPENAVSMDFAELTDELTRTAYDRGQSVQDLVLNWLRDWKQKNWTI